MAEEAKKEDSEKPEKKEEKSEVKHDSTTNAMGIIILFVLLLGIGAGTSSYLNNSGTLSYSRIFHFFWDRIPNSVIEFIKNFTAGYIIFATILCLFFVVGIVYAFVRWRQYEDRWVAALYPGPLEPEEDEEKKNPKWERVMMHISSDNPSDWRLAILEADIMLGDLLDSLGYVGDTIGDKLKKAVRGDFQTLDQAWEAHKIRNAIAHEGQDFVLTQRDAQRIIGLYEQVFREFDFI